jgi:ABC-2 type transport system permease protein
MPTDRGIPHVSNKAIKPEVSENPAQLDSSQVKRSTMFILEQLVTRDFKLKYRRSVLGVVWSVLNPLLMMCVLTLVFSNMFKFPIERYPLYLILGTVLFSLMRDATTGAMSSIITASSLIKKVRVQKAVFPIEKVCFSLVNFALSLIAVVIVMIFFRQMPSVSMLMLPVLLLYVVLFSAGIGLALSALSVFFRDVMHLWDVVIMAWNYLTPIFWPQDLSSFLTGMANQGLAQALVVVEKINPMYHYVVYFRDIFMYQTIPGLGENLICMAFALITLAIGVLIFKKTQHKFILYI